MVGHHAPCVQGNVGVMRGEPLPGVCHDCSEVAQVHVAVANLPEQRHPILRAEGD